MVIFFLRLILLVFVFTFLVKAYTSHNIRARDFPKAAHVLYLREVRRHQLPLSRQLCQKFVDKKDTSTDLAFRATDRIPHPDQ